MEAPNVFEKKDLDFYDLSHRRLVGFILSVPTKGLLANRSLVRWLDGYMDVTRDGFSIPSNVPSCLPKIFSKPQRSSEPFQDHNLTTLLLSIF